MNYRYNIIKGSIGLSFLLMFSTLLSCSNEVIREDDFDGDEILFTGTVLESSELSTRANTSVSDVDYAKFPDTDFYVHIEGNDRDGVLRDKTGTYWVQSSTQGMLWPKVSSERLKWFSRDAGHQFWSWTVPWENRDEYTPTTDEITITFEDSPIAKLEDPDNYFDNGSCLERFVGATNGEFIYNRDGIYVPIQYRHLVSKIRLYTFAIVDNSTGSSYNNLKGNFTLLGMPRTAKFYPRPEDGPNGEKRAPYVAMDPNHDYSDGEGVTFTIQNLNPSHSTSTSAKPYDFFYVCPEMDFSELQFKIELYERVEDSESPTGYKWVLNTTHGNRGAFYGDFRNVTFSRSTTGSNYDDPNNETGNLLDDKILHAGEYMSLVISINSQGVPSVKGTITSWTTGTTEYEAQQHIYPGIYSDGEAHDLLDMYVSGKHSQDEKDEFFDLFGHGYVSDDPDDYDYFPGMSGKKIYRFYDDITIYRPDFVLDSDVMIDGMGHMLDFGRATSYTFTVSKNLRNIYLKTSYFYDTSQWYMIFIDDTGKIWKVDPETWEKTPTSYDISKATYDPVRLSISSGSYYKP